VKRGFKLRESERGRARTDAQSRGDGVGSGSSRRKPSQRSMTPGLTGPLRAEGFPVEDDFLLLVKLPSGGFGLSKRDSPPGLLGPAHALDFQSGWSAVRVRSSRIAVHRGGLGGWKSRRMASRMACDGPGCLPEEGRTALPAVTGR
jgi:hypothetical protein